MPAEITYSTSPLGHAIALLIKNLDAIKQKYSKLKGIDKPESEQEALKLLGILEEVVKKVHEDVLPRFDNQKKPARTELLPIGLDLYQLRNLQTEFRKQLKVTHPIAFEIAELLLSLLDITPPSIKELMPFFNPEALAMDFSSGAVGFAVVLATGRKYKVTLQNKETFTYKLTLYQASETTEREIPAQEGYILARGLYSKKLLEQMTDYLSNNLSSDDVKQRLARVEILQEFIKVESQLITAMLETHRDKIQNQDPVLAIDSLSHKIQLNTSLLQDNERIMTQLQDLSKEYSTQKINQLLERHPQLKPSSTDHDFSTKALPEIISGSEGAIPIKKELQEQIAKHTEFLIETKEQLQEKIQTQTKQWQQETIEAYSANIQTQNTQNQAFQQMLNQITTPDDQALSTKDIPVIKQLIEGKKASLNTLYQVKKDVKILLDAIKKNAILPPELAAIDKDNVVQTAQTQQSQTLLENMALLKQQIKTSSIEQEKTIHELESHVEKMESEAAFLESLVSANPEQMQGMLCDLEKELTARQRIITNEHVEISKSIIKIHLKTKEIDKKTRSLIESLSATAKKLELLSFKPNIDALVKSKPLAAQFIQDITESITRSLARHPGIEELKQYHEALSNIFYEIRKILENPVQEIPIKKIKDLLKLNGLTPPPKISAFDYFLTIIGLEANPSYESLKKRVQGAQIGLDERIKSESLHELIKAYKDSIPDIQQQLNANFDKKESEEARETLIGLRQQQQEKESILRLIETEKTQLENDRLTLETTLQLINDIKAYQQKIQVFSDTNEFSLHDAELYEQLIELQGKYKQLVTAIHALENKPEQSAFSQRNIAILSNLGEATYQRLISVMKLKIDLEPLNLAATTFKDELTEISYLAETSSPQQINTLIERYKKTVVDIIQQDKRLNQLKINVAKIEDTLTNERIKKAIDLQATSQESMIDKGTLLLNKVIVTLTELKINAKIFTTNEPQESMEKQQEYSQKLDAIEKFWEELSIGLEFNETDLPFLGTQLKTIESLKTEITQELQKSKDTTRHLENRVQERVKVTEALQARLSEEHPQYSLREALNTQLDTYKKSGDSAFVLSFLSEKKVRFSKSKLASFLNTITADLMDLDQKIPTNYQDTIQESDSQTDAANVKVILEKYKSSSYPQAIENLQTLIKQTADKWAETIPLTQKLTQTLHSFVLKHPTKLPTPDEFQRFKRHFTARLHSQDDLMSIHKKAWKGHLANFFIGLFTLGIALGIKAIYSSVKEGKATLFFTETNRNKQISSIDDVIKNTEPPKNQP